ACGDSFLGELQQRLAAREHDVGLTALRGDRTAPGARDGVREVDRAREAASPRPIGSDEVGGAEGAGSLGAIGFATGPEVAPSEATEDRGPTGPRALSLQRVVDLLDGIAHVKNRRPR